MNSRYSRVILYLSFVLLLLSLSCAARVAKPKPEMKPGEAKSELFVPSKDLLDKAVSERGDELAPEIYIKGMEHYQKAEQYFDKGKDTAKIQAELEEAQRYAQQAIQIAQTMKSSFPDLVKARDKAIAAGAETMDLASYQQGDKLLQRTASDIEKNDMLGARQSADEALREYQTAELQAVQGSVVNKLNQQLQEAEKQDAHKWAPQTYQTAVKYRDAALEALKQDRYNTEIAQQQIEQGEYYSRKAIFLTEKIKEAKEDRENWEAMFLQREEDLKKLAKPLGLEPSFDEGFEKPVDEIDRAIRELKEREIALSQELADTRQTLAQARKEMQQVERQREKDREGIYEKLFKPEEKVGPEMTEETLRQVHALFPIEKARVYLDHKNNLTITMTGLNFEFGQTSIRPDFYPLLEGVQKAAQLFPDQKIRITGHTDSVGDSAFNRRLSLERARSVAGYLAKDLGLKADRMEIRGAGETEPIASNTTAEGRKLNRRIDITFITP